MLLQSPNWIEHANESENIHPDGTRFATAGGDATVKIWSVSHMFEPDAEKDPSINHRLATLSWHETSVNCVRWSNDGRYLATGSDDTFVMLFELVVGKQAIVPFGSKEKEPNIENWERVSTLRGHTMNIEDVAWSPDDRMLATCSIDNKIIIWAIDSRKLSPSMTEPLRVLSGHTSWVKGVTWDPIGKFLASSSEDKSIVVWRVEDWGIEKRIKEPFEDSTANSYFRRISWSPDGMAICGTNGFKSKKDVAPLIDRTDWTNEIDFVGHQSVITTTRFNPRLLRKEANGKEFACCAIGGDDNTISIWLAQVSRPLAVIKDCFDAAVTDLSWSKSGSILIASSIDGSLCCFRFDANEIGQPLAPDEQMRILSRKFGTRTGTTQSSLIPENPQQLGMETNSAHATPPPSADPRKRAKIHHPAVRRVIQTESTTSSGKKRIMPVLVSTPETSSPVQTESTTSTGKKRIMPVLVSSASPAPVAAASKRMGTGTPTPMVLKKATPSSEVGTPTKGPVIHRVRSKKRRVVVPGVSIQVNLQSRINDALLVECVVENIKIEENEENTTFVPTGRIYSTLSCAENGLIKWTDRFTGHMNIISTNGYMTVVSMTDGSMYILQSICGRRLVPCIELGCEIAILECSPKDTPYLLCVCTDGTIRVWNIYTQQSMLNGKIDAIMTGPVSIDDNGEAHSTSNSIVRARVSNNGQPLITMSIVDKVHESKHMRSFTFHYGMQCWMRVADDSFITSDFNSMLSTNALDTSREPMGPLSRLQNVSAQARSSNGIAKALLFNLNTNEERNVTKTHLENQMNCAIALQSISEYQYWLRTYVQYLTTDEDEDKLNEFLNDLIGPPSGSSKKDIKKWQSNVLGIPKRRLLKEVCLPLLAKNRNLQRLVAEYQLLLDYLV